MVGGERDVTVTGAGVGIGAGGRVVADTSAGVSVLLALVAVSVDGTRVGDILVGCNKANKKKTQIYNGTLAFCIKQ